MPGLTPSSACFGTNLCNNQCRKCSKLWMIVSSHSLETACGLKCMWPNLRDLVILKSPAVDFTSKNICEKYLTYNSTVSEGMSEGTCVSPRLRQSTTPDMSYCHTVHHEKQRGCCKLHKCLQNSPCEHLQGSGHLVPLVQIFSAESPSSK